MPSAPLMISGNLKWCWVTWDGKLISAALICPPPSQHWRNLEAKTISERLILSWSASVYWGAWVLRMRLEAHHLCKLVPNQISETRVLGGVGKESFITLPGKGGRQWASALREEVSLCGEDSEKVYSIGSKRVWSTLGRSEGLVVR